MFELGTCSNQENSPNRVVPVLQQALTGSLMNNHQNQVLLNAAKEEISSVKKKFEEKAVTLLKTQTRLDNTEELLKKSLDTGETKTNGHYQTINFLMEQIKHAQGGQNEAVQQLQAEKRKLVVYEARVKSHLICELEVHEQNETQGDPKMLAIQGLTNELLAAACRLGGGKNTGKTEESSRIKIFLNECNEIVAKIRQNSSEVSEGDLTTKEKQRRALQAIPSKLSVKSLMADLHNQDHPGRSTTGANSGEDTAIGAKQPLEVVRFTIEADQIASPPASDDKITK